MTARSKLTLATLLSLAAILCVSAGASASPLVAAVGDIACDPGDRVTSTTCHQAAVAKAIEANKASSVWLLGDIQYSYGTLDAFNKSFGPAFAKLASKWRPAPGNHEYGTPGAAGYFDFFGAAAGPDRRGYYSFNIGTWHVVSLNSNCNVIDCSATSPQAKWLREDLKANKRFCTAAFWHHPMYSSGAEHGDNPWTRPLWKILQSKRADIVLTGHDHDFEAFKRQDSYGQADGKRGITEFVVGTGGKNQRGFGKIAPNSIARLGNTYGFLSLRLKRGAYNWRFVDENGQAHNVGIAHCH